MVSRCPSPPPTVMSVNAKSSLTIVAVTGWAPDWLVPGSVAMSTSPTFRSDGLAVPVAASDGDVGECEVFVDDRRGDGVGPRLVGARIGGDEHIADLQIGWSRGARRRLRR